MTTTATETKWSERVREWRESGKTALEFAQGKGFEASTLRYWASRLGRADGTAPRTSPRFVRLVKKSHGSGGAGRSVELVIEVGSARMRVGRGFDRELLAEVVGALAGGASR